MLSAHSALLAAADERRVGCHKDVQNCEMGLLGLDQHVIRMKIPHDVGHLSEIPSGRAQLPRHLCCDQTVKSFGVCARMGSGPKKAAASPKASDPATPERATNLNGTAVPGILHLHRGVARHRAMPLPLQLAKRWRCQPVQAVSPHLGGLGQWQTCSKKQAEHGRSWKTLDPVKRLGGTCQCMATQQSKACDDNMMHG